MIKEICFAGGCYWGVEHLMNMIDGVQKTVVGFANGHVEAPAYEEVYTDSTGHAEAVLVRYDTDSVSLRFLTECLLRSIDLFSLNRQGEDVGTRYRSGIYYTDEADAEEIRLILSRFADRFAATPVVECLPLECFYSADERHQRYLEKNPGGYCHIPLKCYMYVRLLQDLRNLLGAESDPVARMANAAALIKERTGFFWVGFYRVDGEELVLGPFQGSPACQRIGFARGVCGTAWAEKRTIVVKDVEEFPGHIACSSLSRSEIVVPIFGEISGEMGVTAVLDIDSDRLETFDDCDALWLEAIAGIVI